MTDADRKAWCAALGVPEGHNVGELLEHTRMLRLAFTNMRASHDEAVRVRDAIQRDAQIAHEQRNAARALEASMRERAAEMRAQLDDTCEAVTALAEKLGVL